MKLVNFKPEIGQYYLLAFIAGNIISPRLNWVRGRCVENSRPPVVMGHIFVLDDGSRVMKYSGDIKSVNV